MRTTSIPGVVALVCLAAGWLAGLIGQRAVVEATGYLDIGPALLLLGIALCTLGGAAARLLAGRAARTWRRGALGGTLVMVAIHTQPREVNLHRFFWRELEMVGARLYERRDFEEAAALIASGVVPAEELVSAVVPLEAAAEAFASLAHGGVMKVLVDCAEAGKGADDV